MIAAGARCRVKLGRFGGCTGVAGRRDGLGRWYVAFDEARAIGRRLYSGAWFNPRSLEVLP